MSTEKSGLDLRSLRANKLDLIERLADDLAHEIKNPLHSMVINLEVLKRRITRAEREDTEELARYANVLGSELERVSHRVELLLRLVRAGRGSEPTTLGDVVADLAELIELERDRRGIELHHQALSYAAHGYLPADVARQLVLDLMLVALDSLRAGDRLEIRTGCEGGWERLTVRGIAGPADSADEPPVLHTGYDDRLTAARALTQSMGGQLHVNGVHGATNGAPERSQRPDLSLALPISLS